MLHKQYMKYGPFICIGTVVLILFILWAFIGGKEYKFIGLDPLMPNSCDQYGSSFYNWKYGDNCVPKDTVCKGEDSFRDLQGARRRNRGKRRERRERRERRKRREIAADGDGGPARRRELWAGTVPD